MKLTFRLWVLIIVLILAALMISPSFEKGVIIKSVEKNSTAFNEGLRAGMVLAKVNGKPITTSHDYTTIVSPLFEKNGSVRLSIETKKDGSFIFLTERAPEITVGDIPRTKIKTGLDLSGGARALVRPANVSLSSSEINDLVAVTSQRLNAFGITDVTVRPAKDLQGNNFMLVEIAGATPTDIQDLVGKQGKFEAKVGNTSVFEGGDKDISSVCRNDASCAGVTSCFPVQTGGYACNFAFTIYLTEEAAQKHASITKNISLDSTGQYLSQKLYLYVDDQEVDSLLISSDLKGRATTQISIQGSGAGRNQEEALTEAKNNMKKLQTILITGSLPYKLEIVKLDTISPFLGKEFTRSIMLLALVVFIAVSVVLFVKYRKIKITLAVILTMFCEAFITLGIAALIKWNLDAPSIAGIIAGMGTGVNDQIVLIDEAVNDKETSSAKERIKRALFIIFGAFFTIVAAMLPLFWAGAGLLRGFALTTIIGVSVGILITRPAFADILRKLEG
ncbi:MMPL family transporter [Candidatus Pacearchaeota archaeon]|nr:MMPL family transporter [Candidatus Pacearchaeota archaeon]